MHTLRIALVVAFALLVAAGAAALADSNDVGSGLPDPNGTGATTTLPDQLIEDPPLPMAPDGTTGPDQVIEDPPLPMAPDGTTGPDQLIEDPPLPMAPDSTTAPDTTDVLVYFVVEPTSGIDGTDFGCGLAAAVTRQVQSPNVLSGAIDALLAGPTDEEVEAGYWSVFTGEVGWELASVTISDGTALIDFGEDSQPFNNMSASCVHLALVAQLETTATQFSTVDRAIFSVGGDIPTFYHWLERDVPEM